MSRIAGHTMEIILRGVLALIGGLVATGTGSASASEHVIATIPFQLIGNHIYTQARLNGTGPYLFIVDTGGVNLVTSSLRNTLGLPVLGNETGHGVGAEPVDSDITTVRSLELGGHRFAKEKFFVFDMDRLFASGGVHMKGMVGFQVFQHFVTRIDFAAHEIRLLEPKSFKADHSGTRVPMVISENELHVPATFDGVEGTFQIDTGSGATLELNSPFVAENHLRERFPNGFATTGAGVGGETHGYTVRGRDLKIGDQTISHPIVQFSTNSAGVVAQARLAGNIGLGALKRFTITFDFDRGSMYLQPSPVTDRDLDTYDRSGMALNVESEGFRVQHVVSGSPAAEAGIHVGDIIESIDDSTAMSLSLPAARDSFRKLPAGTTIRLGLRTPSGDTRKVQISLRDLI